MLLFGKKITTSVSKSLFKRMIQFWFRRYRYFFALFFIGTISLGVMFWKNAVVGYRWSEERKEEYANTHSREVEFQERSFHLVREQLEKRDRIRNEKPVFRDFFHTEYSNRSKSSSQK